MFKMRISYHYGEGSKVLDRLYYVHHERERGSDRSIVDLEGAQAVVVMMN